MGNCQAAEAAAVVIQHPGGRLERMYWSLSASEVMASNPGHYVAVIITSASRDPSSNAAARVKHLKLLRPDDTLNMGHVYRLVSFEDVLKEFASKKHVKLSRFLLAHEKREMSERGGGGGGAADSESSPETAVRMVATEMRWSGIRGSGRRGGGEWKPALQSIAEVGS